MKKIFTPIALLLCLLLLPGCGGGGATDGGDDGAVTADDGETPGETTGETNPAEPDDPEAVEALESLEAKIKRDGQGFVEEVDFRGVAIDDEALSHLPGLKRVRRGVR